MHVRFLLSNYVFLRYSLYYNTSSRHEQHHCGTSDTSATWTTRVRREWDMSDTSSTRVLQERYECDTSENIDIHNEMSEQPYISYTANERSPAKISTLFQRCLLVDTTSWRQLQLSVETKLCVLTMEFTLSNNVESMLCISTLIWTTLGNVETTLSLSTSNFTTLVNVEATLWKWPFIKQTKQIMSNRIHGTQTFNYYFIIFFTLLTMLRGICPRVFARQRKFFRDLKTYSIAST